MNISYDGIGELAATFRCSGVTEGHAVKLSASETVAECSAGDAFCGVAVSVSKGGDACAVQLRGMVTIPYTGTAPAAGSGILAANGSGGVKTAASGGSYLIVAADTTAKTVTILL